MGERAYYLIGSLSFSEWLTGTTRNAIHALDPRQQKDWLIRDNGVLVVDFVGRFENLVASIDAINKRLGINIVLPHENRSEHSDYRHYYSEKTRDYVAGCSPKISRLGDTNARRAVTRRRRATVPGRFRVISSDD